MPQISKKPSGAKAAIHSHLPVAADIAGPFCFFMRQVTGKQILTVLPVEASGLLQQKAMVISGNPIGVDLQMGMQQRSAGRRQMVLGDGHIYCLRVVMKYFFQICGGVHKTVGIR